MLIGAGLRLYHLDTQSTWADELCRVVWAKGYEFDRWFGFLPSETGARLPPRDLEQALSVVNRHNPPLNSILLNAWMRAAGSESDFATRLPSALLGILSILGMFLAASHLLGPRVGVWAAALVALSPFHVFYAQEVNHYALAACLVAFSLWFYFRWLERPRLFDGVGLAVTGLGVVYTHYIVGIALFFQAVELFLRYRRQPRLLARVALPYLAIAVGFAPYLPTLRRQLHEMTDPGTIGMFRGIRYFAERMQAVGVLPWLGDRGEYLAPLIGVPIVALGVGLFVVGLRIQTDRLMRRMLLLNAAGPVVIVSLLYWLTRGNSILWSRYQLFFTFAQFIPIAAALHHARYWRWLVAPVLAALAVIGFRSMYFDLVKEDWKHAAATIASHGSRDENVVVYRPNLTYAVGRYLDSENRLFGVEGDANMPRMLAVAVDGSRATWFVSAWAESAELPAAVHAFLSCRYAHREDFPVAPGRVGMTVTRYSEPRASGEPTSETAGGATGCRALALAGEVTADWERVIAGPVVEGGLIDVPTAYETYVDARSLTVTGWAFSTRGIKNLVFDLDGREVLRARQVGLLRPDVAAAYRKVPETHTLHAGFWAVLDLSGAGSGVHSLVVTALHADGSTSRIGTRDFVLQQSAKTIENRQSR